MRAVLVGGPWDGRDISVTEPLPDAIMVARPPATLAPRPPLVVADEIDADQYRLVRDPDNGYPVTMNGEYRYQIARLGPWPGQLDPA